MERVEFFLGQEIEMVPGVGILLHQAQYAWELLNKARMWECKPKTTPMEEKLGNTRGCEFESRQGHERCSSPARSRCRGSRNYSAPAEVASGTHVERAVRSGRISTPWEAGEAVGITTPTSGDPALVAVMI